MRGQQNSSTYSADEAICIAGLGRTAVLVSDCGGRSAFHAPTSSQSRLAQEPPESLVFAIRSPGLRHHFGPASIALHPLLHGFLFYAFFRSPRRPVEPFPPLLLTVEKRPLGGPQNWGFGGEHVAWSQPHLAATRASSTSR